MDPAEGGVELGQVGHQVPLAVKQQNHLHVLLRPSLGSQAAQPPDQRCAAGRLRCNITTGRITLLVHRNKDGSQVRMAGMLTAGNSVDILARQPAAAGLLNYKVLPGFALPSPYT